MTSRIGVDEPVGEAVRRIGGEQLDEAISRLRGIDGDNGERSIHECRKLIKKSRGLIRLVRPAMGDAYRPANAALRDAARQLSPFRDAHALAATFDDVIAADTRRVPTDGLGPVWRELARRAEESTRSVAVDAAPVQRALELLEVGATAVDSWTGDASGWDALSGGLTTTYRRGAVALAKANKHPTASRFHELRKRAKYTRSHLELIDTDPPILEPLAAQFHALSDSLGDAHDLAVLSDVLSDEPDAFGGAHMVEAALELVDGYRSLLERRGAALASWLYAERPQAFAERLGTFWELRPRLSGGGTGELAELFAPDQSWDGLSLVELRRVARRLGLPGRSTMRRDRLVAALRAEGARPNTDAG